MSEVHDWQNGVLCSYLWTKHIPLWTNQKDCFQQQPVGDEFAVVSSRQTFYHTTLGGSQDVVSLCKVFGEKGFLWTSAIKVITGVTRACCKGSLMAFGIWSYFKGWGWSSVLYFLRMPGDACWYFFQKKGSAMSKREYLWTKGAMVHIATYSACLWGAAKVV